MWRAVLIIYIIAFFNLPPLASSASSGSPSKTSQSLTKTFAQVKVAKLVTNPEHFQAQVKVRDGESIELTLEKISHSIFASGFKIQLIGVDSAGNLTFQDVDLSKKSLMRLENRLFIDRRQRAVVKLVKDADNGDGHSGGYKMSGIVRDHSLTYENGEHVLRSRGEEVPLPGFKDGAKGNSAPRSRSASGKDVANPELAIVIGYDNYKYAKEHGKSLEDLAEYFALMINAVNLRYESALPELKIRFSIIGISVITAEAAQPFYSTCLSLGDYSGQNQGSTCRRDKLIDLFGEWAHKYSADLPEHDHLSYINSAQDPGPSGGYDGFAFLRGACEHDGLSGSKHVDRSTSVVRDYRFYYMGVHTLAHEIGHNLGAWHDGEAAGDAVIGWVDARGCNASDGYVMSYLGYGGLNKYSFSPCSISAMANYISLPKADCLRAPISSTQHLTLPNAQGGEFISTTKQCQTVYGKDSCVFEWIYENGAFTRRRTEDEKCRMLLCINFARPGGPGMESLGGYYVAEHSSCGVTGICSKGFCTKRPSFMNQCRNGDPTKSNVWYDTRKSPDSLCKNLDCQQIDSAGKISYYSLHKPALEFSPCGENGRCINATCREPATMRDLTTQCQIQLADRNAKVAPPTTCRQLYCDLNGNTVPAPIPTLDFTQCGVTKEGQKLFCFRDQCATFDDHYNHFDQFD